MVGKQEVIQTMPTTPRSRGDSDSKRARNTAISASPWRLARFTFQRELNRIQPSPRNQSRQSGNKAQASSVLLPNGPKRGCETLPNGNLDELLSRKQWKSPRFWRSGHPMHKPQCSSAQ